MSGTVLKKLLRPTAFRVGLLVGAGVCLALAGASYGVYRSVAGPSVGYNVEIASAGPALTRAGARQLEVRTTYGPIMRQACNGACDDLTYRVESGDNAYRVAILNAKGGCISCDTGLYVDKGLNTVARFDVREGLTPLVQANYYKPQADGSLKPLPPPAK